MRPDEMVLIHVLDRLCAARVDQHAFTTALADGIELLPGIGAGGHLGAVGNLGIGAEHQVVISAVDIGDGAQELVSSDDYNLKIIQGGFSRVVFEDTSNLDADLIPFPYEIVFVAGYGANMESVPDPIKTALKIAITYWYQNRGDCDCGDELPGIAKGILREYRIVNTYG